jgi:hypothetical protein
MGKVNKTRETRQNFLSQKGSRLSLASLMVSFRAEIMNWSLLYLKCLVKEGLNAINPINPVKAAVIVRV